MRRWNDCPYARGMPALVALQRILDASGAPDNPTAEELSELFATVRTIAVIGMSRDPAKAARRGPSYLATKGYEVIPVNPLAERILGRTAYATVSDVPQDIDLVEIFSPSESAGTCVAEATRLAGKPAIWLQEGIWARTAVDAARRKGFMVVQNMCTYRVHGALHGGSAARLEERLVGE